MIPVYIFSLSGNHKENFFNSERYFSCSIGANLDFEEIQLNSLPKIFTKKRPTNTIYTAAHKFTLLLQKPIAAHSSLLSPLLPVLSPSSSLPSPLVFLTAQASTAQTTSWTPALAPNIPPSVPTISTAASCNLCKLAPHASPTRRQSNPRSFPSRIVQLTQTSVVTPVMTRFLIPLTLRISSKSV